MPNALGVHRLEPALDNGSVNGRKGGSDSPFFFGRKQ